MANAPFTIGRNTTVVFLWNGQNIQLPNVTGFRANQETKQQRSDPLNSLPIEFNTPSGWRGQFDVDRQDATLDILIAAIEAAFWNAGTIANGTIYQYIYERDGSTSCYEFTSVAIRLSNAGDYRQEQIVKQTVEFFASQRNMIS
nr:hypothetical protein [uncultured Lichenicoccus sp.]